MDKMAEATMNLSSALALDDHYNNSKPKTNGFYKISFDKNEHVAGVGILIDSRLSFTCLEDDSFIVRTEHRELLDKTSIVYEIVEK